MLIFSAPHLWLFITKPGHLHGCFMWNQQQVLNKLSNYPPPPPPFLWDNVPPLTGKDQGK